MEPDKETPTQEAARIMRQRSDAARMFADSQFVEAKKSGDAGLIARAREVRGIVRRYFRMNRFGVFVVKVGGFAVLAGLCVLALQGYWWLRDGQWIQLPLLNTLYQAGVFDQHDLASMGEAIRSIEWQGVQKIVAWLYVGAAILPVSGTLFGLGIALVSLGLHYSDRTPK